MAQTSRATIETNNYNTSSERHLHFFNKGETIPLMSQGVWQICQGLVRLSTLYPVGEEGLLGWVGPSMCFGSCFSHLQTYRANALSDVCLMWYTMIEIEASPKLAQELLPQLGRRFRQTEALLAIVGQRRVEDRLHQLLLLLKQEFGQPVTDGTRLSIRLTHQDIAGAICTTRVTVTRILGKLQQQGWLSKDKDRHLILKNEAFAYSSDLFGFVSNNNH
ncbi:MAG: Crp/Fnr family transcriptional regulator [Okeania sp. SIO2G4]|uniref:Crp/Fnr family transcriptional regulator n=1 Tax=unclassified Okeania TaxID=2634635 RepID=UPI0013B70CFC|nr:MULTISPECIES: Crp/Fnr family transcriptional regulator [unclassified Okeania]NEP07277.1 Crp/Fnr family transcriptional regulator [Okeania sp. SIO4D6]NEP38100.1 Crp/Fnr family transcriptional regulator [Okeania sp. SIO2H7]NEP71852.1 Crp/Fnr family transcriptional regulator [Okeania sp. SIO2G5]NEP92872.1 Crp/Fnr family transcriptional regulator [Okeania sp. SIO2F5]NEQ90948.1 Crp/Fnr family transcriptional regulator [Okeania sp. SIO2G4]